MSHGWSSTGSEAARLGCALALGLSTAVFASACSPGARVKSDLAAMREELAAQRRAQSAMLSRVERLETRERSVLPAPAAPSLLPAARALDPLDGLPVVKLAAPDSARRAPALDTRVSLVEPSAADLAALDQSPSNLDEVVARTDPAAESLFAAAVRHYNEGDRRTAGDELLAFADAHPDHDATDNALYLVGMVAFADGRCADARRSFERVTRDYGRGDAAGPALLARAQCEQREGRPDKARTLFEQVLDEHPRTAEASQAEASLSELARDAKAASARP